VNDSSGVNWCGRRTSPPTFSNEVGVKKTKKNVAISQCKSCRDYLCKFNGN